MHALWHLILFIIIMTRWGNTRNPIRPLHWFTNHFLLYAPQVWPLLLLLDGHSTYYGPEMINIAPLNQIIIFALPPHTMHVTQPLDYGCFSPLKIEWRWVCHKYISENPGKTVPYLLVVRRIMLLSAYCLLSAHIYLAQNSFLLSTHELLINY